MKNFGLRFGLFLIIILTCGCVFAQNNFWKDILESNISRGGQQRQISPQKYRTLVLDTTSLKSFLLTIPKEFTQAAKEGRIIITLPMPDGTFAKFKVFETAVMEPGLAAQFPEIKTYNAQGVDDPYATAKIDWSPRGFHAMIVSPVKGAVFIDPYTTSTITNYISYFKKDIKPKKPFIENGKIVSPEILQRTPAARPAARPMEIQCVGTTLRTYRLAVACTGEYAQALAGANPTVAQTLAAIVTTINRVNSIYESDLDIRMILVNNNNRVVYTDSASDPFTGDDNADILIEESQTVIDNNIGSANYDVGHTLSTASGGLAKVGVVCFDGEKASGVTGNTPPSGDPFDVDYVAHEMGHEFGGVHTFNAETGNCGGQGDETANAEPGSGSTIMAYAGICGTTNDLQPNSDPYFHALSLDAINDYITNGPGATCAVQTATGNAPPVVNAGLDYTIPRSTPFVLTGSATDANNDSLTYSWEQVNVGGPYTNWNAPKDDAPIFRSLPPVTTPVRFFPRLSDILNNTVTRGELLPTYTRTLLFRLTARDNRAGGGGVCSDEISVVVAGGAGPFRLTVPDTATTWDVSTFKMINWSVNNTNRAPVNCANVAIELSTDGGQTFPITLVASTPNDGSELIVVPDNVTTTARVRVRALNNIFFDVSNTNFRIQPFVFTAEKDVNNTVRLQWQTPNEIDSLRYEVERSEDGATFSLLAPVNAGNNPRSLQQYTSSDAQPFQAVNFYRIKMIDKSGRVTYSKILSVEFQSTGRLYVVFPNPTKFKSSIRILSDLKQVSVRLIDAIGRQVFARDFGALDIGQVVDVPVRGLARGIYVLAIYSDHGTTTTKIMVQ